MRRTAAVTALTAALVAALSGVAAAHAVSRSSSPPANAVVKHGPSRVVIAFTEHPDPKVSFIQVLTTTGRNVATGPVLPVPGQPNDLQIRLGSVPDGIYTVTWRTVSTQDGHTTTGSFSFGVGNVSKQQIAKAPQPNGGGGGLPGPLAVAGRWLLYWGLALLFAAALAATLVFRGALPLRRIALPCAWALAVAGFAMMVLAERSSAGVSIGTLLSSPSGHHLLREGVGLAAAAVVVPFAPLRRDRASLLVLGGVAAATMLLHAMNSHASAASPAWFNVGVQWFHLLAVGAWVGGLVWLLLGTRHRAEKQPE